MHSDPLVLFGIHPHLSTHSSKHLRIPVWWIVTRLRFRLEHETTPAVHRLLADQRVVERFDHLAHQDMILAAFVLIFPQSLLPCGSRFATPPFNFLLNLLVLSLSLRSR